MRIAILSDIHDNVWTLKPALEFLRTNEIHGLICCGDLCSPFVVGLMLDDKTGYPGPIHVVFGNNDADLYRITQQAVPGRLSFYGEFAELMVEEEQLRPLAGKAPDGTRIAVNHFNYLARPIAASGKYDVIFYGHNHRLRYERLGHIDVINPGAIMGYDPAAKRSIPPTFVIYDTAENVTPAWYEIAGEVEQGEVKQLVRPYLEVEPEEFQL
jgi:uncharacterized protein